MNNGIQNIADEQPPYDESMKIAEYYSSKYASIDFANHIALPAL